MSDVRELYQEIILDHGRRPRNFGPLESANHHAEGYNPLCGDRLTLHLQIENDTVVDAHFEGSGCAISTASASVMTQVLKGKTVAEARALFERFKALVTGPMDTQPSEEDLGKLAVFAGVREFPVRVKCATLAWHTMDAALDDRDDSTVTTE
jgi:nitrogen fixation NifU-like protein